MKFSNTTDRGLTEPLLVFHIAFHPGQELILYFQVLMFHTVYL